MIRSLGLCLAGGVRGGFHADCRARDVEQHGAEPVPWRLSDRGRVRPSSRGEEAWLHSRTCANGRPGTEGGRGDVGPGGQCGAIIDVYEITCPEGALQVAMDMYQCGPNEDFM